MSDSRLRPSRLLPDAAMNCQGIHSFFKNLPPKKLTLRSAAFAPTLHIITETPDRKTDFKCFLRFCRKLAFSVVFLNGYIRQMDVKT